MLTTTEAARRLGVKPATLYAYVSRGVLRRTPTDDGRGSLFDADEVEALARRGRPRRSTRPAALEFAIETRVTEIRDHRIRYRGRDAAALARTATFEQVAELLWTGTLPGTPPPWTATPITVPAAPAIDQLRIAVALAAAADPLRGDLRPDAVAATARTLLATMVESLPVRGDGRTPRLGEQRGTVAGRLWARLADRRPRPGLLPAVNAALVLLADHDIATSTLAARVAASTRADPYAVVAAGMGTLAGPLHGGASRGVRRLLDDAAATDVDTAVRDALALHGHLPGFGHPLYVDGDPRAAVLLRLLRAAAAGTRELGLVDAVAAAARRRSSVPPPNVDYALGGLTLVAGMPPDAGEVLFTVARTAGWVAHALEELGEPPLRFRPRGVFVGD